MKKNKIIISVIILTLLIVPFASMANGESNYTYVAIGDSIPYGVGATDHYSYTDMLNEHFTRVHGPGTYYPYTDPGMNSIDFVNGLAGMYSEIEGADYVTICVGSNNLLFVAKEFLLTHPHYLDFDLLAAELMKRQMELPYDPELDFLFEDLMSAFGRFQLDWFNFMAMMPGDAEVIVSTVYNPFKSEPVLHALADPFIIMINDYIYEGMDYFGYKVADVYSRFEKYNNPRKPLVHDEFSLMPTSVYLHPTDRGQKTIFNLHKSQLNGKRFGNR